VVVATPTATNSSSLPTGALIFKPAADAYVTSATPNTNYGTSKYLRVDGAPTVNSYLLFNVQGLTAPVASVKLKVYVSSGSKAGIKIYSVSNTSWVEKTITFNNAPALGSTAGSSGRFKAGTWVTVDITSLIKGNGLFSVAITDANNTAIRLYSREGGKRSPQLVITTR
jgi:hypothetical protein